MDLTTVRAKLERGAYQSETAFFQDVELVISSSLAAHPHSLEDIEAVHEFEKLFLLTQRKHSTCRSKPQCRNALKVAKKRERDSGILEKSIVNVRRARRTQNEKKKPEPAPQSAPQPTPQTVPHPESAPQSPISQALPQAACSRPTEGRPRRVKKPNSRYLD